MPNVLFITDIDECETEQHGCCNNSQCIDTIGSYRCDCLPGYYNNATIKCVGEKLCILLCFLYYNRKLNITIVRE